MKRKDDENVEHRGNNRAVAEKLQLEMQLIRNINQEKPVYSFEKESGNKKRNR